MNTFKAIFSSVATTGIVMFAINKYKNHKDKKFLKAKMNTTDLLHEQIGYCKHELVIFEQKKEELDEGRFIFKKNKKELDLVNQAIKEKKAEIDKCYERIEEINACDSRKFFNHLANEKETEISGNAVCAVQ